MSTTFAAIYCIFSLSPELLIHFNDFYCNVSFIIHSSYLHFLVHLHVDGLDLVQLVAQADEGVLLLVDVLLQEFHGHLHFLLHAHLHNQLILHILCTHAHVRRHTHAQTHRHSLRLRYQVGDVFFFFLNYGAPPTVVISLKLTPLTYTLTSTCGLLANPIESTTEVTMQLVL